MKRLAVLLSMMVCIFGPYQLYAARFRLSRTTINGIGRLAFEWIRRHDWPWWAVVLLVAFGIAAHFVEKE